MNPPDTNNDPLFFEAVEEFLLMLRKIEHVDIELLRLARIGAVRQCHMLEKDGLLRDIVRAWARWQALDFACVRAADTQANLAAGLSRFGKNLERYVQEKLKRCQKTTRPLQKYEEQFIL
jgi:hypothetical protein